MIASWLHDRDTLDNDLRHSIAWEIWNCMFLLSVLGLSLEVFDDMGLYTDWILSIFSRKIISYQTKYGLISITVK